jgi:hypothetical protein
MEKITSSSELKDAIRRLEEKKKADEILLKEEFEFTREKLKPSNVIRTTFNQVFTGPNLIRTVMIASLGLTAAYISKKYFQGLTGRLFRRLLGHVL